MVGVQWRRQPDRRAWLLVAAVAGIALFIASVATVAPAAGTASVDLFDEEKDEPPMAEAGLDQEADVDATVYLDASGSWAPDGDIESFEWTIERPNETYTTPDCPTCEKTQFVPRQVGVYNVTLTVTATNGLQSSDTMYVTVKDREPPTATLTGPAQVNVSEPATLTLDAEAGTHPLMAVSWYVNGDLNHSGFLDDAGPWQERFTFDRVGLYEIGANVVDESGYSAMATHELQVGTDFSHFDVTITDTSSPVLANETLEVTAEIENRGTEHDTQTVILEDDAGALHDRIPGISLGAGESTTRTFTWTPCLKPDADGVAVRSEDDIETAAVDIGEADCAGPFLAVESVSGPAAVRAGNTARITATVRNTGNAPTTQEVRLRDIFGAVIENGTREVSLDPGEVTTLNFEWATDGNDVGEGVMTVATDHDSGTTPLEVLPGAFFDVSIRNVTSSEDGSTLVVNAIIENNGRTADRQDIVLKDGAKGNERDRFADLHLPPGERQLVELWWTADFHEGMTVPLYVASEDDNATTTYEWGERKLNHVVWFEYAPEAVYPGQRITVETLVHRYMVSLDEDGEVVDYDLLKEWIDNGYYISSNAETAGSEVRDIFRFYSEDPAALRAYHDVEIGAGGNVCIAYWWHDTHPADPPPDRPVTDYTLLDQLLDFGYEQDCRHIEVAGKDDERVEEVGELNVQLVDKHGNPLGSDTATSRPRVTYDRIEYSKGINENGWANFTELEAGELDVEATADGYIETADAYVENHNPTTIRVQFDKIYPTGTVSIQVWDTYNNELVEGAEVRFNDQPEGLTDANGRWSTNAEVQELAKIEVRKEGKTAWTWVDVEEDQTTNKKVELELVPTGRVQFWVYDLQGNPVEGARVETNGESAETGPHGKATFQLETGTHSYSVREGFETESGYVTIKEDHTAYEPVTMSINGQGTLQVTVRNMAGDPIPGAEVSEDTLGSAVFSGQTDYSGQVEFTVDEGTYDVIAEIAGNDKAKTNIDVNYGERTEIDIVIDDGFM